jgi:hypothetical protein
MRRMAKLIDGLDPSDFVAAAAKDRGIVREAFRVAGYRDSERHLRGGEAIACDLAPARGGSNTTAS